MVLKITNTLYLLTYYTKTLLAAACLFATLFNSGSCYPPVLINNAAGSLPNELFE